MTTSPHRPVDDAATAPHDAQPRDQDTLAPLHGEIGIPSVAATSRRAVSKKRLLATLLLVVSGGLGSVLAIQRCSSGLSTAETESHRTIRDKPAAAITEPRKLDLPAAAPGQRPPASAPARSASVPALLPTQEELAEPIGVRRTGSEIQTGTGPKVLSPEDAPVLLVSTRSTQGLGMESGSRPVEQYRLTDAGAGTHPISASPQSYGAVEDEPMDPLSATSRNLQGYQRQLQGLLETLTRTADLARNPDTRPFPPSQGALGHPGAPPGAPVFMGSPSQSGLLGGHLLGSSTPRAVASRLSHRSLTLPKGTAFTCALKSRVVTASAGLVGCMVQHDVYGDDGRVLLIERGSHLDGEYRITTIRPGSMRIPVLWTRVRTPLGVVVDIDSPATGSLGESGIDGHVDNRWSERIGAAMLLSLIDDSVKLIVQQPSNDRQGDTIVLPSTTANSSKLAEKVLDSTINIPPLIYQNQGSIVGIYVARDVDFSGVYELVPTTVRAHQP